jgi:hypothetical protein
VTRLAPTEAFGVEGAAGNLKQAEDCHSVLLQPRETRRQEMALRVLY